MAKISAHGAKEIARWVKSDAVYVLTLDPKGKTKLLQKWTKGASYTVASIPCGRKANGTPIYSERPTLEQAQAFMDLAGYERVPKR